MLSSKCFIILQTHEGLWAILIVIFVYDLRKWSTFTLLHTWISSFSIISGKRLMFPNWIFLVFCQKLTCVTEIQKVKSESSELYSELTPSSLYRWLLMLDPHGECLYVVFSHFLYWVWDHQFFCSFSRWFYIPADLPTSEGPQQ